MATNRDLLKEAIADAKAVKETAIANAKAALEEAFTPFLKEKLSAKLAEMENEEMDEEMYDEAETMDEVKMEDEAMEMDEISLDELLAELELEEGGDEDLPPAPKDTDPFAVNEEKGEEEEMSIEDMSEDDLKSFIEDVIKDMVSAGELEAGHEGMENEEGEEEESEEGEEEMEAGEEEEIDEEINIDELLAEMEVKFENERQKRLLSISNAQIKKNNSQILLFRIGFVIFILLLLFFIYFLIDKTKINKIILLQKKEVETQNQIIEDKNKVVETQNKDIRDSIRYAERIQSAILPPKSFWSSILPNSFVFYRPKEVLSGDFHWIAETDTHIFVAAADCTGHGVPGAFISIVNYNLLNKAVLEKGMVDTALILDAVNTWLTESLHQTYEESSVKDGMDVSLISINKVSNEVYFSGAYHSIYLVRNDVLVEYKGDKFPVGVFIEDELNQFRSFKVDVQPGDMIYLFTDGFADQFGGPKGKKYKYAQLRDKLVAIGSKDMEEQSSQLMNNFDQWKGNREQVDDGLILGIRF